MGSNNDNARHLANAGVSLASSSRSTSAGKSRPTPAPVPPVLPSYDRATLRTPSKGTSRRTR